IALLCSVTGFVAVYATTIDVLNFIREGVTWEIALVYLIVCYMMIISFCAIISYMDGTSKEKANFISIASIGASVGIGVIVANELSLGQGLLGTIFEFFGGFILAFYIIALGIYVMVLIVDFVSELSDKKPIRRAFVMFFLGYVSVVALSVFDAWRWLITL
ncbi:MAG: hypothetical protein KJ043_08065, partial [Anaerolineae bacterium]|nr:hypothetical protein [Anaerolineae bacterium]